MESRVARSFRTRLALLALALGALLALPVDATAVADENANAAMVAAANADRQAAGLAPLARSSAMDAVAQAWAEQLARNGSLSHNPSYADQIPGGWRAAAENVASGYRDPVSMQAGWMDSPGHRRNLLGDYTHIGVAFVQSNGTWGVQVFAKYPPGTQLPGPAAPAPAPAPAPEPAPAPDAAPAPAPAPAAPAGTYAPAPESPASTQPGGGATAASGGGSDAAAEPTDTDAVSGDAGAEAGDGEGSDAASAGTEADDPGEPTARDAGDRATAVDPTAARSPAEELATDLAPAVVALVGAIVAAIATVAYLLLARRRTGRGAHAAPPGA